MLRGIAAGICCLLGLVAVTREIETLLTTLQNRLDLSGKLIGWEYFSSRFVSDSAGDRGPIGNVQSHSEKWCLGSTAEIVLISAH